MDPTPRPTLAKDSGLSQQRSCAAPETAMDAIFSHTQWETLSASLILIHVHHFAPGFLFFSFLFPWAILPLGYLVRLRSAITCTRDRERLMGWERETHENTSLHPSLSWPDSGQQHFSLSDCL
ncbi:hypothetical protein MHYP_G00313400 [Metynnis hypsauchen]